MIVAVGLGLWVARKGKDTAQSYFLGNKTIPWFVVGASMVAADISSEQFISNVSGAYKYGHRFGRRRLECVDYLQFAALYFSALLHSHGDLHDAGVFGTAL